MLGEDFCSGWLHSYLYEMIYILDRSWLIPDQSGHHSPDWFGESIFPVSHRRSNCGKIEGRREQRREGDFFGAVFIFERFLSAVFCSISRVVDMLMQRSVYTSTSSADIIDSMNATLLRPYTVSLSSWLWLCLAQLPLHTVQIGS